MYSIIFKKSAEKEIVKLPAQAIKRISTAIDSLAINPRPAGSKKLEGQKESLWRIRVGDYRVIYLIEDVIKIVEIRRVVIERTSTNKSYFYSLMTHTFIPKLSAQCTIPKTQCLRTP